MSRVFHTAEPAAATTPHKYGPRLNPARLHADTPVTGALRNFPGKGTAPSGGLARGRCFRQRSISKGSGPRMERLEPLGLINQPTAPGLAGASLSQVRPIPIVPLRREVKPAGENRRAM